MVALLAALCHGAPAKSESAVRKDVEFSVTADVGFGNEVCVLGAHPALGGGNALRAPKLAWTPGNLWRGTVALEAGTAFSYRFISRNFSTGPWGNAANLTNIGDPQNVTTPAHMLPPWGSKMILYRTTWAAPRILYRDLTHNGAWSEVTMSAWGPGRVAGEMTFSVQVLAPSGSELEFVFNNGAGNFDNAPAPPSGAAQGGAPAVPAPYQGLGGPYNYRTSLDVFLVQGGGVFNYLPPDPVSAPRFETRQIGSTVAGVPGRPIRILLPRGYDQNSNKRYPVVYFHDGDNVFFPGGPFGTWDADRIAGYETSQGRMRESILVAIPSGNGYGSNRLTEYLPAGETIFYAGQIYTGNALAYVRFMLENVMPTLDVNYRTMGDAANTLTAGSSMGGLIADFIGFSQSARFGGIGIFSPAYWAAPLWVAQRDAAAKLPLRRYLYMGTAESSTGESSSNIYWNGALQAYNSWVKAGHSVHRDLLFEGGAGAAHNELAWSRRLPAFFAFALDPWREGNALSLLTHPPQATVDSVDLIGREVKIGFIGRFGMKQSLGQSGDLLEWTSSPLPREPEWWNQGEATVPLPEPAPAPPKRFWRLYQNPWPAGGE